MISTIESTVMKESKGMIMVVRGTSMMTIVVSKAETAVKEERITTVVTVTTIETTEDTETTTTATKASKGSSKQVIKKHIMKVSSLKGIRSSQNSHHLRYLCNLVQSRFNRAMGCQHIQISNNHKVPCRTRISLRLYNIWLLGVILVRGKIIKAMLLRHKD